MMLLTVVYVPILIDTSGKYVSPALAIAWAVVGVTAVAVLIYTISVCIFGKYGSFREWRLEREYLRHRKQPTASQAMRDAIKEWEASHGKGEGK